jgi:hypothetical protein
MPRQDFEVLVTGYMRAVSRFMTGGDRPGPLVDRALRHAEDPSTETDPFSDEIKVSAYYHSLFEALNWAYTLDDRLTRRDLGPDWYKHLADDEDIRDLAKSVPAIRYARNAVQHQWDEAVYLDEEKAQGARGRTLNVYWYWLPELGGDKRDPTGRMAYAEHLAGHAVLTTLTGLMPVFSHAAVAVADRAQQPNQRPTGGGVWPGAE